MISKKRATIPFEVKGIPYVWEFRDDGELMFYAEAPPDLLGIALDPDDWNIPAKVRFTGDTGSCPDSLAVFRKAWSITDSWLEKHQPLFFWIRSSPRKMRIFSKQAARSGQGLGYSYESHDDRLYFHRT
jgi:hypothetical protein